MTNKTLVILKKELKETFRDKKSLTMMLIIPLLIPFMVMGMAFLFNRELNLPVTDYNKIGFSYPLTEVEKQIADNFQIDVVNASEDDLAQMLEDEEINLYIAKENNEYYLKGHSSDNTSLALNLAENYLRTYKEYLQTSFLNQTGMDASSITNIITWHSEITSEDNFFKNYVIIYAFMFILMAITVSATYPATDATAGEKERGTLETLLTLPLKSKDIIVGKFLNVALSSIITGILSLILAIISLRIANSFPIFADQNLTLSVKSLAFSLIAIITYSLLISGLCIAIASRAKTFKEAQSALTPLTFISFFPSMIAFMINLPNNLILSCIPFLNTTLIFTDIINNQVNIIYLLCMLISNIILIIIVFKIIINQYHTENILFND